VRPVPNSHDERICRALTLISHEIIYFTVQAAHPPPHHILREIRGLLQIEIIREFWEAVPVILLLSQT